MAGFVLNNTLLFDRLESRRVIHLLLQKIMFDVKGAHVLQYMMESVGSRIMSRADGDDDVVGEMNGVPESRLPLSPHVRWTAASTRMAL
jgi:hypothetical protein